MKPLVTQKHKKSWIYRYSFRVVHIKEPNRTFFVCRYCHARKIIDAGGGGLYETTSSTSTSARHLEQEKRGHGYQAPDRPAKVARLVPSVYVKLLKMGRSAYHRMLLMSLDASRLTAFGLLLLLGSSKTTTRCASSRHQRFVSQSRLPIQRLKRHYGRTIQAYHAL